MTAVSVFIPDAIKDSLEQQAAQAGFSDLGAYLQKLLVELCKSGAKKMLDAKIREGLRSPKKKVNEEFWEKYDRLARRGGKASRK